MKITTGRINAVQRKASALLCPACREREAGEPPSDDEMWELLRQVRRERTAAWDACATKSDLLERAEHLENEAASLRAQAASRM